MTSIVVRRGLCLGCDGSTRLKWSTRTATATATATYALDRDARAFFATKAFRFVHRHESIVGKFGRYGSIKGTMNDRLLIATWRDETRRGWLTLAFSRSFRSFRGNYGQYEERRSVRGVKRPATGRSARSEPSCTEPPELPEPTPVRDLRGRRAGPEDVLEFYRPSGWRE